MNILGSITRYPDEASSL